MATYDDAIQRACEMGTEAGIAAASWVFDGSTTRETYLAFLQGWEDGDPAILDQYDRSGWLSGEWAGDPTPQSLLAGVDFTPGDDPTEWDDYWAYADDICQRYELAADNAYWTELQRVAHLQTERES